MKPLTFENECVICQTMNRLLQRGVAGAGCFTACYGKDSMNIENRDMKKVRVSFELRNIKRRLILLSFDLMCYLFVDVFFFFVALRAAGSMPVERWGVFIQNSLVHLVTIFGCRSLLHVYKNVWRYSNTKAYLSLVISDALGGLTALCVVRVAALIVPGVYYGILQAVTVGSLTALLTLVSRFVYTYFHKISARKRHSKPPKPVAIVGAGRLGSYLAGDLSNNPNSDFDPVFFIDTDSSKIGKKVAGLYVYDPQKAEMLIRRLGIQDVIISIARKDSEEISQLYNYYQKLKCRVRAYDALVTDCDDQKGVLREFSIEDLLFRKQLKVKDDQTDSYYYGKTVLVTGGGGSIGSELCRQIALCHPKKLVIFDIYENNAYEIQQELIRKYGDNLHLVVEIGSVRDVPRLDELFRTHLPQVVFHAAAHKHVPLMETSGAEAIKNNCFGTYNTANAAEKYGVEKFILISTDKAVNPTNIMGASKRVCEMIVQSRFDSKTSFAAVRFGNVLGSNGSVIPLFKKQIAAGGPVTITDKRIIRYFMTIPEASQLVLHAGAMAQKGELFVLDMGRPVKIYDLAVNMIRLSGFEPDVDIAIQEIGLRPGEKLYEELLMKTEQMDKTENNMIFIERDMPYSRQEVEEKLRILQSAVEGKRTAKQAVTAVVPTFCDPTEVNIRADNSEEMKMAKTTV